MFDETKNISLLQACRRKFRYEKQKNTFSSKKPFILAETVIDFFTSTAQIVLIFFRYYRIYKSNPERKGNACLNFIYFQNTDSNLNNLVDYLYMNPGLVSTRISYYLLKYVESAPESYDRYAATIKIKQHLVEYDVEFETRIEKELDSYYIERKPPANGDPRQMSRYFKSFLKKLREEFILENMQGFFKTNITTVHDAFKTYCKNEQYSSIQFLFIFLRYRANFSPIKYIKAIPEYYFHIGNDPKVVISKIKNYINNSTFHSEIEMRMEITRLFDQRKLSLYEAAINTYGKHNFEKVYFTLQNFVTYLTYRSNGSPQKLIKAIHEFIIVKDEYNLEREKTIVCDQRSAPFSRLYLYFNLNNQYRIGFISYLYRPFLIKYGRSFKHYSDNIIVSTPYLFDHLLKFHPFAFSLSNLELVPEVLSTNKTPFLRDHLKQIIDNLANCHLRETEISLFDYKFYSRTLNEISYLSKIFEQEAAAFNFTLDESYLVKLHIRDKIKELRSIYAKFIGNTDANRQQIFSIAHLNGILGDLYFFDQEYDDAIVAYSDAIRPINQMRVEQMEMRDFISLIKNKLKLGLCYEKTSSYQEALAFYVDSSQDAKRFMEHRLSNHRIIEIPDSREERILHQLQPNDETKGSPVYFSSALTDVLQIILQCFVSKIFLQEKMGIDGISDLKLSIAIGGFLKISDGFLDRSNRNHLVKSNLFLFSGKLLYFKNSSNGFDINELNCQEHLIPDDILEDINEIKDYYGEIDPDGRLRRKPVMALCFYILGLRELLKSKSVKHGIALEFENEEKDNKRLSDNNIVRCLINRLQEDLKNDDEQFRGVHYRYIATFLSNIGDCLFGMYSIPEHPTVKYNRFEIDDLFNAQETNSSLEFISYIKETKSKFDLTDVLKCYFLSGKYFLKYGRSKSGSFQYYKILNILRVVLFVDTKRPPRPRPRADKFLKMVERTIVSPILLIASENSGFSDIHMLKKAEDNKIKTAYAINNLSNHPETREVIFIFSYIKIKLKKDYDLNVENYLISPLNSISTQYARFMELDFYVKYIYEKELKKIVENFESSDFKKRKDKFYEDATNYLYGRLTILRILEIYGFDYSLGFRYFAYTHFHLAEFLSWYDNKEINLGPVKENLDALLGQGSYSSLNSVYHYQKAKEYYEKTIKLNTAGIDYRKMINDMVYLEDDFSDNAYHFGAALDRYLMVNGVLHERIEDCRKKIIVADAKSYSG